MRSSLESNSNICFNECPYGSCCQTYDGNFILGPLPVEECYEFIRKLSQKFNKKVKFEDVFLEVEEGSALFPSSSYYQNEINYPAIRVEKEQTNEPCIFYNTTIKACSVYDIRPGMCRRYGCDFYKSKIKDGT